MPELKLITNPARSAFTSISALAGRGGGIIPPDLPASPFITLDHPDYGQGCSAKQKPQNRKEAT